MSNPILLLASQLAPHQDGSPAAKLAQALLDKERDYTALAQRYEEQAKRLNALVHEVATLREMQRTLVQDARHEPQLSVYCDEPSCTTPPLTIQIAPPEECVPMWIRGRGWASDGVRHYCGEHKR